MFLRVFLFYTHIFLRFKHCIYCSKNRHNLSLQILFGLSQIVTIEKAEIEILFMK